MSDFIRVAVEPTNPGQFFACCGLLELAHRLWPGAEGWFEDGLFQIQADSADVTLANLFIKIQEAGLTGALTPELRKEREQLEDKKRKLKKERIPLPKEDEVRRKELGKLYREGHLRLGEPFNLLLDWWQWDDDANPKTWAGSQAVIRIARAALAASHDAMDAPRPFDYGCVMRPVSEIGDSDDDEGDDAEDSGDKVEPFYFDARRGSNAQARDIGFMPDALKMMTAAYPAVEFFCLVGLQRTRPVPIGTRRVFDYFTWNIPLSVVLLPAAVAGLLGNVRATGYRFENAFRTDQKKHKAFLPATPIGGDQ
jgi:hypothetical protein